MLKLAVEKEQVAIIYISTLKIEGKNLACHIPNISFSAPMTLKVGKKREENRKWKRMGNEGRPRIVGEGDGREKERKRED